MPSPPLEPKDMLPIGLGIAKNILALKAQTMIPIYVLGLYCLEGDNSSDGIRLATLVSDATSAFNKDNFKDLKNLPVPFSWHKFYGPKLSVENTYF